MRSLNKINKNHPKKKNTRPAAKKESHKNVVSLADKKKIKNKKVVGKIEPQHKKKSAPVIKAKPSKGLALKAAVKKQPVKSKPAVKAVKQSKKKVAPVIKAKSSKGLALKAAVKKQPVKSKPAVKAVKQSKKKAAPVIKTKPSKGLALKTAVKKQPVKGKPAVKAVKPSKKKDAPIVKEKTFETKVTSFEMERLSEETVVIVTEEIQTQHATISSVVLGKRFKCYKCGMKFYDLGKPQPLCPSCGANQLDEVIKVSRKRRGRQRSAFAAKTEPHNIAPDENEELREVVDELDAEFVLDVDDIVVEERENAEDNE